MAIDYSKLPPHMQDGAKRYIELGIKPGDFLTAVICNDFMGAFKRADDVNTYAMRDWAAFFYNEAPVGCYGSKAHMDDWVKAGGLVGMTAERSDATIGNMV